nr:copper transporter [Corynebacterium lactis]
MAKRRSGKFTAGVTGAALGVAAGAALGAYVLNPAGAGIDFGGSAAAERDAAVARADAQEARVGEANRILEPVVGEVVKDSLADVPVLVVAAPDATDEQLKGVAETLKAAGAPDAGVLKLTDKFLSASGADELKDTVTTSLPTNVKLDTERRDPGRQAGQALAPVLELGKDGGEQASAADRKLLLEALKGAGFVDYKEGTLRPPARL